MKIIAETSALISASVFWKYQDVLIKHRFFDTCNKFFETMKEKSGLCIITKTIEDEARYALDRAVVKTIRETYSADIEKRIKVMTLQHVITNFCLDRLDKIVEECSARPPLNIAERDKIMQDEIEPFLKEIVKKTVRYLPQPSIPRFIKGKEFRSELSRTMAESSSSNAIVYKGMPAPRDLRIMAEATMIYRSYEGKEKVYVASRDKHFIPNPIQIGSFLSGHQQYLKEPDPRVRDMLAEKFGFTGEFPQKILDII